MSATRQSSHRNQSSLISKAKPCIPANLSDGNQRAEFGKKAGVLKSFGGEIEELL